MATFEDVLKGLWPEVEALAKSLLGGYAKQALADSKSFVKDTEKDLKRWTQQLLDGEIPAEEYTWLVRSKTALAKLTALKQKGLGAATLTKFRYGLADLIVSTALKLV